MHCYFFGFESKDRYITRSIDLPLKLYFCISKLFRKCKCLGYRNALRISFLLMWAKFVKRFILLVSYITRRCILLAPQAKKFTSSACIVCQRECVTLKIEKIYVFHSKKIQPYRIIQNLQMYVKMIIAYYKCKTLSCGLSNLKCRFWKSFQNNKMMHNRW